MKPSKPIIAVAVLVVAGLVVICLTSGRLESPQARLYRQIDEQIEEAQRMLATYEPAGSRFLRLVTSAASQPADLLSTYDWQDNPIHASFADRLQGQQRQLQALARQSAELGDEARPQAPSPGSAKAYEQLEADLKRNERVIAKALDIVKRAVSSREEVGEETVSGSSHVTATRLEAILIWHQADLLRRRAAVQRAIADTERTRFGRIRGPWHELETIVRSLEYDELHEAPGEPGTPMAEPGPAADQPPPEPVEPGAAPEQPKPRTGKGGAVGKLARWLFGKKSRDEGAEPVEPPTPEEEPVEVVEEAPAEPGGAVPLEGHLPPTLAVRTAKVRAKRAKVITEINQAKADVDRLTAAIDDLKARIAEARSSAEQAEKRMFELEEAGVDPVNPDALQDFISNYKAASEAHRAAARETATLEEGSIRNARPNAEDEDEMLTAPLVRADPDREMQHERGLLALESDLRAAQGLVETLGELLAETDRQIDQLTARQQALTEQLAELRASRAGVWDEATKAVRAAIAAVIEADKLETEATGLINGEGKRAAGQAKAAASQRIRDARALQDSESKNPRLELIVQGRFIGGHAAAVDGDLEYLRAMILAQRAEDLERHQRMLQGAQEMGIRDEADLLPEAVAGTEVPAWAFRPEAAGEDAETARDKAIEAARQARKIYEEDANSGLNDLWMLRANIAAVHYLLANLQDGPEARTDREAAVAEYRRSIQNREDRPEAELYRQVMERLEQVSRR